MHTPTPTSTPAADWAVSIDAEGVSRKTACYTEGLTEADARSLYAAITARDCADRYGPSPAGGAWCVSLDRWPSDDDGVPLDTVHVDSRSISSLPDDDGSGWRSRVFCSADEAIAYAQARDIDGVLACSGCCGVTSPGWRLVDAGTCEDWISDDLGREAARAYLARLTTEGTYTLAGEWTDPTL